MRRNFYGNALKDLMKRVLPDSRSTFIVTVATCLTVVLGIPAASCSGSQKRAEQPRGQQCLSLCMNQFASCTEKFPGDASACLPSRNDCQRTCEGDAAERRLDDREGDLVVPTDSDAPPFR